ncbi:MAG: UvrD-helicase domain-containing protein [Oscillospiraceae bacterium]|jgi:ATP-dependent helicase/nuclease subunit A|nr:UvrD-helicase domain-containing protein [Oscillospiraceae bacterium]
MNLTAQQQAAVDLRGRTVLVSAAAGAGKTRVLVERLMGYVTDPSEPRHIDEFLVITYTRAAAGELRERIAKRLRELCEQHPDDRRLREQLTRVYTAKIGTLDAFCREIILENASLAGLPSGYRIADAAEAGLLRSRVLEETLDALYERAASADPFSLCAETYGDERGDRVLSELILHIWEKTRCHADPMGWLRRAAAGFLDGADSWRSILFEHALCVTETFRRDYERLAPDVLSGETGGTYGVTLERDLEDIRRLVSVLERGDWDAAAAFIEGFAFEKLKTFRAGEGGLPPEAEAFKTLRERWKREAGKLPITGRTEEHERDAASLFPLLTGLCEAVSAFDAALTEEKTRLAALDFSDVERMTLNLLLADGGALSERVSSRFCEILVDEAQDINPLQDAIIEALSRDGGNLFYVGDARQSIYRFQMADPSIFLKKYNRFADYAGAKPGEPCRVSLTVNFRSEKPVLDAVNRVFSRIECPELGVLPPSAFLIAREERPAPPVEWLQDGERPEAELVAGRLRELIESGEAAPGECVILLRSPKARLPEYRVALEREGLLCAAAAEEGFLSRPEIQAVLSALDVIDNARLDVSLISVLRSRMVGLSPDGLAELRVLSKGPLCECLPLSHDGKVSEFTERLKRWRVLAADLPPYALAARVMADTALPQRVSLSARENLLLLPEVLRGYAGELSGLRDWAEKTPVQKAAKSLDAVRIMSIHASKGLEFPVVVAAGLSKPLNLQDQRARLLAHPRLGLAPKMRDAYSEYPTPAYRAVQAVIDSETRAEELRLLYVAMTRAEKRLILSGGGGNKDGGCGPVTKGDLILRPTVAEWVRPLPDTVSVPVQPGRGVSEDKTERGASEDAPSAAFAWRYPHPEAVNTPSKMTATGLKRYFPDEHTREDAAEAPVLEKATVSQYRKPYFLTGGTEKAPMLTAAERGTAVHLFLQFCDFSAAAAPGGVRAEAERLRGLSLLTPEQAEALDAGVIERFFRSKRGKTVLTAGGLRREQKFSLLIAPGDVPGLPLPPGETVLLQGVIDCSYETPEGLVLLDFKTDRVPPGGERERAGRYKPQMEAYAAALAAITKSPVRERVLIFLATGAEVAV